MSHQQETSGLLYWRAPYLTKYWDGATPPSGLAIDKSRFHLAL